MNDQQYNDLIRRINAIESAIKQPESLDYSDPPLILTNENNTPIDPSTIETIPDLVKNLSEFLVIQKS